MRKLKIGSLVLAENTGFLSGEMKLTRFAAALRAKTVKARVEIEIEVDDENDPPVLKPEVRAGIEWLHANEAAAAKAVVDAIRAKHTDLGPKPAQRISLKSVSFHDAVRGDLPYIGFLFGCDWEEEHGLGLMMHGTRLVEIGGADTAILGWIARRDAGTPKKIVMVAPKKGGAAKKKVAKKPAAKKKIAKEKARPR